MLAFVSSASLLGVEGHRVTVEVHASSGLPSYTIVGLPYASWGIGISAGSKPCARCCSTYFSRWILLIFAGRVHCQTMT